MFSMHYLLIKMYCTVDLMDWKGPIELLKATAVGLYDRVIGLCVCAILRKKCTCDALCTVAHRQCPQNNLLYCLS